MPLIVCPQSCSISTARSGHIEKSVTFRALRPKAEHCDIVTGPAKTKRMLEP